MNAKSLFFDSVLPVVVLPETAPDDVSGKSLFFNRADTGAPLRDERVVCAWCFALVRGRVFQGDGPPPQPRLTLFCFGFDLCSHQLFP